MVKSRPEPSESTVKTLFALSMNVCAFLNPDYRWGCEEKLTDPRWARVNGRICHIRGLQPGSRRFDGSMSNAERNHFDNLLLLCPAHHVLIDELEPERYTVEVLTSMKSAERRRGHEEWTSEEQLDVLACQLLAQMRPVWGGPVIQDFSSGNSARLRFVRGRTTGELVLLNEGLGAAKEIRLRTEPDGSLVLGWAELSRPFEVSPDGMTQQGTLIAGERLKIGEFAISGNQGPQEVHISWTEEDGQAVECVLVVPRWTGEDSSQWRSEPLERSNDRARLVEDP